MAEANYFSQEFYNILNCINGVLNNYNISPLTEKSGIVFDTKYSTSAYENVKIWRVTNSNISSLLNEKLMDKIYYSLKRRFTDYINNKLIVIGNPRFATDINKQPIASIVIKITDLPDNIISKADVDAYNNGDYAAIEKLFDIESRMFRRDGDNRDQKTRLNDFIFSLDYEPKLVSANLYRVSSLELQHRIDAITLETDKNSDFTGIIDGKNVKIEGKSTKANLIYRDTIDGHSSFAQYFSKRLSENSLGSTHDAEYVLFIIKRTGEVICINLNNLLDNWLAGKISIN